jgi:hypothetical protein
MPKLNSHDTIFDMKWTQERKLVALMTFHMLWGLFLWFSISKYGLGISTDSVHLLFASLNLSRGNGLFSFDGSFVSLWPPLHPMLLALIQLATRFDPFVSATILQVISFIGISLCLSILFLKIFPENFFLALAANILSDIGVVVLTTFDGVGSDYLHFFFLVLFVLLAGYYIETKSPRVLLGMTVVGMMAMLDRYLGIAAIGAGVAIIFFSTTASWRQRIVRSSLMALSALPAGIWLYVSSPGYRGPESFTENFFWFSTSVLQWFFPISSKESHLWLYISLLWLSIGVMIFLLFHFSQQYKIFSPYVISILVYGLLYLLVLFGSASIAYFNKLTGRFLLPVYIPFITLLVLTVDILMRLIHQHSPQKLRRVIAIGFAGALIVLGIGLLRITIPVGLQSHANGNNDFNDRAWHENSVMNYWLAHEPQGNYLLFSNYPDGIAFYTWHTCYNGPAEYSGPYGKIKFPATSYSSELFSSGLAVYLIWIEPNIYSYYYKAEDLSSIAQVKPIFVNQDGGIYLLTPKAQSSP